MYKKTGRKIIFIFLLTIIAFFISLPREIPIKFNKLGVNIDTKFSRRDIDFNVGGVHVYKNLDLKEGLDLVGGSHLVFEADTSSLDESKKEDALQSLREVIERRVNLYGVSEPNIQIARYEGSDRVIVELPGVTDTQEAIDLVGKTAQLTFMEVQEVEIPVEETPDASAPADTTQETLVPTDLTGADLKGAQVGFNQVTGKPVVQMQFTDEGRDKFSAITERNVGKMLPIVLDNDIVSTPLVEEKIVGDAEISGEFSLDEAKQLAIQLNAGALPVGIKLVSEQTVGASLGREAVQKSIQAGVVGLLFVLIFMVVFYGRLGLVADIGLVIFGVLTLALYKIIPVVLTLPGIAGFLLSVGMAVDANILTFERFREEKAKGINILYALETSFGRAWDSIRDANIATLVTAFILANPLNWSFLHTSGPVRGFAITLALGIGVSLFTGIFVSRNLLRFFVREGKKK